MHKDDVEMMFTRPNEHTPFEKPVFIGSFYIRTNVNKPWEQLKDRARTIYPIENFDWEMREFAIYDNNGYILQFERALEELNKTALVFSISRVIT